MYFINKTACSQTAALGMEDGSITNNKITVSSTHAQDEASWGRLHCSEGSWTPNSDVGDQWFQVDFAPEVKLITRIATQGYGVYLWWVKTYYVMYKSGGADLQEYMENKQPVVSEVLTRIQ